MKWSFISFIKVFYILLGTLEQVFGLQQKGLVTLERGNLLSCLDLALLIQVMLILCMAVTYFQISGTLVTLSS
jgi:hypothetical protein